MFLYPNQWAKVNRLRIAVTGGGTPEVTYKINDHSDVVIGCTLCDNRTPMCETLTEAVSLWNQVYCCTLPFHEIKTG